MSTETAAHASAAGGGDAASGGGGYPQAPVYSANPAGAGGGDMSSAAAHAVSTRGTLPSALNLDDIFGDCFFTPEGETVFLSDQPPEVRQALLASSEAVPSQHAARPSSSGQYVPVANAGGIAATGLDKPGEASTVMGGPTGQSSARVPFAQPPQKRHHLPYAMVAPAPANNVAPGTMSKQPNTMGPDGRKMSDQQKVERRERNREHAKRSRIRKKFLLESLQQSVTLLKEENDKLRDAIRTHLGPSEAEELLRAENLVEAVAAAASTNPAVAGTVMGVAPADSTAAAAAAGLIANQSSDANKVLDDPDFSFIKALQTAQQNFVVTDPSLPDNPIVYATQGFLNLTGYTLDQVLGRNCRFLQGPETDPKAVEKIRKSIEEGSDMSVCLLNYRVDGTTFWNQFFIAALRDASGNITNYVGVQCKVSDQYAANVCKKQEEAEAAAAAAAVAAKAGGDEGGDEDEDDDDEGK